MMNVCLSVYVSLKLQRNSDNNLKVTWQCKDEANVYNILVQWLVSGATQCRKDHQEELGYWYPHQVELAVSIIQPEKKSVAYNLSVIGINQQQQKWEKFGVNSVNLPRMWKGLELNQSTSQKCGKVWSSWRSSESGAHDLLLRVEHHPGLCRVPASLPVCPFPAKKGFRFKELEVFTFCFGETKKKTDLKTRQLEASHDGSFWASMINLVRRGG